MYLRAGAERLGGDDSEEHLHNTVTFTLAPCPSALATPEHPCPPEQPCSCPPEQQLSLCRSAVTSSHGATTAPCNRWSLCSGGEARRVEAGQGGTKSAITFRGDCSELSNPEIFGRDPTFGCQHKA